MHAIDSRRARWEEEARFFDAVAARSAGSSLEIDPLAWRRYALRPLRRRFSIEHRFALLGDLRGRRLLDVGCGDGLNAALFARMGAHVTGVDISPLAISQAKRRAAVNGLSGRTTFVCGAIESVDLAERSFDVVWGDGILHHVLDELEPVVARLARLARRDGLMLFSEPVNLFPPLRRLRGLVPVVTEATPGERPLLSRELALLGRYIADMQVHHYGLFGRLDALLLTSFNYERSSPLRRAAVNATALADRLLLALPYLKLLGGTAVIHGSPRLVARAPGAAAEGRAAAAMASVGRPAPAEARASA